MTIRTSIRREPAKLFGSSAEGKIQRKRRFRDPERTRERLLQAAFREVHRSDLQGAGIDAILAATNVTKGCRFFGRAWSPHVSDVSPDAISTVDVKASGGELRSLALFNISTDVGGRTRLLALLREGNEHEAYEIDEDGFCRRPVKQCGS